MAPKGKRTRLQWGEKLPATADKAVKEAALLREQLLQSHINYTPRQRYPVSTPTTISKSLYFCIPFSFSAVHHHPWTMPKPAKESSGTRKRTQAPPPAAARRKSTIATRSHRKNSVPPKERPTGYDTKRGWLIPWKKIPIPVSPAPSARETVLIEKWKENQKRIQDGPLYVHRVVDGNARVGKRYSVGFGLNAFNATPTWTATHERKYRNRPNLSGKLWCM